MSDKQFRSIIAGTIIFIDPTGAPGSVNVNALLTSSSDVYNLANLNQMHQALANAFGSKLDEESAKQVQIVDVVIMNIMPLGVMTDEEFNTAPVEAVEKAANDDRPMAHHHKQ